MTVAIGQRVLGGRGPSRTPAAGREDDPRDQTAGIVMLAAKLQSVLTCSVTWPGSS